MLIEFSVKNFRSIKNKQVFSLVKNSGEDLGNINWFEIPSIPNLQLLNSSAIYGANAAGKSNLIMALEAIKDIVVNSAENKQRGDELDITPFLFCSKSAKSPSEFEISFISNDVRYQYGFAANKDQIIKEWLIAYPKGRPQKWFNRTYKKSTKLYTWEIGSNFTGKKQHLFEATRPNALFLSTAIQLNNKQLQPIYDWFNETIRITKIGGWGVGFSASECQKSKEKKKNILRFLKAADLGISDVIIESEKFQENYLPSDMPQAVKDEVINELKDQKFLDIKTIHKSLQGEDVLLGFDDESDGTQKIFSFAGPWLDSLKNGYVLVIDELHDNLHPKIVEFLIMLFHNKNTNPKNAQLIFTTHETAILNQEIFRRDQIWFCEKDEHQSTYVFPLTDFRPRKNRDNLEISYLGGRYGALPFIGYLDDLERIYDE